jgi:carboxyl-terminal processing protease
MTLLEFVLAAYAFAAVWLLTIWRRPGRTLWMATTTAGAVLAPAVIIAGRHRIESAPMVVAGAVAAWLAFRRSGWRAPPLPRHHRVLAATLRYAGALLVALAVVLDAAFIEIFDPLSNAPVKELLGEDTQDFSHLPWPDAFEKLNDHLSRAYAMGAWKRIDWKALHDATAPRIAAAAAARDRAAYYVALREYLWSMHDGHVDMSEDPDGLRKTAIQGGYGLLLIRLDDGRAIAHVLIEGGPAASQGMRWGATILTWNGLPLDEAASRTPVLWNSSSPATREALRLARWKLLTRAPVGTRATITFQNTDETTIRTATLEAVDDAFEPLKRAGQSRSFRLTSTNIDWRMLPEGIGYLKIRAEIPTLPQLLPERVVRRAVEAFVRAGAHGIVIDVRGNVGGADKLVPLMMGYFVDDRRFYEQASFYNDQTSQFQREKSGTLWTEPREPHFAGPIAVLIDEWCASSGEGFALVAHQRPAGHVVGFYGTYGSFGMAGAEVLMPGGITLEYPNGQSLDANGAVQLDSDWRLEGGIAPDIRVPLTFETVRAQFKDGHDVVLEAAVKALQ